MLLCYSDIIGQWQYDCKWHTALHISLLMERDIGIIYNLTPSTGLRVLICSVSYYSVIYLLFILQQTCSVEVVCWVECWAGFVFYQLYCNISSGSEFHYKPHSSIWSRGVAMLEMDDLCVCAGLLEHAHCDYVLLPVIINLFLHLLWLYCTSRYRKYLS